MSEASNNPVVEGEYAPPFKLVHELDIDRGGRAYGPLRLVGGRLFVSHGSSHLACVDARSRDVLWELAPGNPGFATAFGDDESLFTNIASTATRLDPDSGAVLWQAEEKEKLHQANDATVMTAFSSDEDSVVRCRESETGELLWTTPHPQGSVNDLLATGDHIITQGDGYLSAFDPANGELRWQIDFLEWCKAQRAAQMEDWLDYHKASHTRCPFPRLGPLTDDTLYLSLDVGIVIALDATSGELRWLSELASPLEAAQAILLKDGRLYFTRAQYMGTSSNLYCLDAADGSRLLHLEEDFSPGGATSPVMLGNLFVAGGEGQAAAYDIEAGDFVWRYKSKRRSGAFTGRPCPMDKGFAVLCRLQKKLQWFESAA